VNTDQLMQLALQMAELDEVPGDSAVHHPGEDIERILLGIDLKGPELKLAADLRFDCAISHHPVGGSSTLRFHRVLERHVDQMVAAGVPRAVAEETMAGTIESRRVLYSMANYDHDPSIARLLDLPYLNIHTPLDEIGRRRMAEAADDLGPDATASELVDHLYETFGEFRNAETEIEVRVGTPTNGLGHVVVSHGAGTNGGYPVAKAYFDHGVDTVVYIHCRPDDADRLSKEFGEEKTLIVAGHIASDSVGINPYVDRLREEGLDVTTFSGIIPA
jgi:hypothetical protein